MSLSVYLTVESPIKKKSTSGIFVRKGGSTKEITREEWDKMNPDQEPVVCEDSDETNEVFSANITHNLATMADKAGIYKTLWRPEEINVSNARQLIPLLATGLGQLEAAPEHFKVFNPPNGWGDYDGLVQFVREYLAACMEYPEAAVSVWR